ncbi:hypothetical protein BT63DRAFT_438146 [Microthyrium microscopicum]|uniref:Uncharacterized protein n=1 Tax=Microthyrium microscopicum TaxID=703497 RepID=A0A6A6UJC1_9PEZI|nr:hypothetical protein BT63DRAFT_438146 [Microthyrium microscopicum]
MAFLSFVKALLVPLLISALIYCVLFFAVLPLYRRHIARYSQYLPLQSASSTPSIATRARDALSSILPTFLSPNFRFAERWLRPRRGRVDSPGGSEVGDDLASQDEELEEAVWDGIDRRRGGLREGLGMGEERPRLSRDLEEGFRDSSDEERDDHVERPR